MKVHRVTLLVVDHDELGADEIQQVIESVNYPNGCMIPSVMSVESREIGEWHDGHPLNSCDTQESAFEALFSEEVSR